MIKRKTSLEVIFDSNGNIIKKTDVKKETE
jgi:hypothetical protein